MCVKKRGGGIFLSFLFLSLVIVEDMIEGTCFHQRKRSTETAIPNSSNGNRASFPAAALLYLYSSLDTKKRAADGVKEYLRRSHTFISASSAVDRFKLHLPPLFFSPFFPRDKKKRTNPAKKGRKKKKIVDWIEILPRRRIWRYAHPSQIKLARINFFAGLSLWWWTRYFTLAINECTFPRDPKFFLFFIIWLFDFEIS